ncbi:MAG TPA: M50 family metallopeptidase [Candidatus Saccharimonadales bacterium]|nr:M50 family metallopeptidase [Candidatus Saccharimonadales bacterium]
MSAWLLIVGLILFIGLVVVHEWGHFIMARRGGVEVEEFGIFFPPRLFKHKTKGGWNFTINLLPLGGFVKMKGEHDSDTEPGSFGAASLGIKSKIMAAGVVMNLIVGVVLLMIVAWVGIPQLVPNQFTVKSDTHIVKNEVLAIDIAKGSAAQKAGLQPDDQIVALGPKNHEQTITDIASLQTVTKKYAGQTVNITYRHKGDVHTVQTTLESQAVVDATKNSKNPKEYLGVALQTYTLQRSTWSAPIVAIGLTGQFTALTFQGLGHALGGLGSAIAGAVTGNHVAREHGQTAASSQVSGPVGIFVIMKDGSLLGYQFMLLIIAVISLTLAIMNILPIPALDGGRLWLTLIMRGLKKPLTPKREEAINATGFLILIALIAVITFVDVNRFF